MPRIRKLGNVPYICRIDQPKKYTHGWYLRIGYRASPDFVQDTDKVAHFFSDRAWGGKDEALAAAIKVRDLCLLPERRTA